jgi:cytochrome c-type biogenesis protein CcmH/NrfG
MYCTHCEKLVSEKSAGRRQFCPHCGRRLHWFGIPEVTLSKPILQAILKRKNFLLKQKLQHIEQFYFHEKKADLELIELQDALSINPDNINAHFQMALYYLETKRSDKAKQSLNEVIKRSPDNLDALFHLANLAVEEEDYKTAIQFLEKVLIHDPNNMSALYNRAVGYYYLNDLQKALDAFRDIQQKDPDNPDILAAIREISAKWN